MASLGRLAADLQRAEYLANPVNEAHAETCTQFRPPASRWTRRRTSLFDCSRAAVAPREVATELHITEDTVKAHMKSILSKLDAKDRSHAVMLALKRGILEV